MNPHRFAPLACAALLAFAATGCGRDSHPTSPGSGAQPSAAVTPQVAEDVARHFASTLARGTGVPVGQVGSTTLQSVGRDAAARDKLASRVHDEGSFSWSWSVTFFDAAGAEQPHYIHGETARLAVRSHVRGEVVTAEHRARVGIARALDVHGLLPAETEIEIDGAANDTASCAFDAGDGSASRRYDFLSAGTLTDVRQLKDESENPYPLSGTAHWHVNIDAFASDDEGEREAHYEADVTVTFNGTRHPVIEVAKSWRYRVDLETGEIAPLPS